MTELVGCMFFFLLTKTPYLNSVILTYSKVKIISAQDPDATLRQNKVLDDLDQEDERYFLQNLFVLIRAGQLEKVCHFFNPY